MCIHCWTIRPIIHLYCVISLMTEPAGIVRLFEIPQKIRISHRISTQATIPRSIAVMRVSDLLMNVLWCRSTSFARRRRWPSKSTATRCPRPRTSNRNCACARCARLTSAYTTTIDVLQIILEGSCIWDSSLYVRNLLTWRYFTIVWKLCYVYYLMEITYRY